MRLMGFLFVLLFLAMVVTLAWQNAVPVQLNYPGGSKTLPLAVFCTAVLVTGWLLGVISMLTPLLRQRNHRRKMERRCHLAEKEITNLREIPLKNGP